MSDEIEHETSEMLVSSVKHSICEDASQSPNHYQSVGLLYSLSIPITVPDLVSGPSDNSSSSTSRFIALHLG